MASELSNADFVCHLRYHTFPEYWKEHTEIHQSSESVLERLDELTRQAKDRMPDGNPTFFISRGQSNDFLHMGVSERGWLIVCHFSDKCQVSLGNTRAKGYTAFLFPEWTETSNKHLIDAQRARDIIRKWLTTGNVGMEANWTE